MLSYTITPADKNQRLDKYIHRRLPDAPSAFIYKMLRKKNITLNGHKASGSEIVNPGDVVKMFLSDETVLKFGGVIGAQPDGSAYNAEKMLDARQAFRQLTRRYPELKIVYEDDAVAAAFKPAGLLSQKADAEDLSLNEWFLGYLLEKGEVTESSLRMFTPSVQNRLDRNTEGLVLLAKTLQGSHFLTAMQREGLIGKYYQMVVVGRVDSAGTVEGWLEKDSTSNTVQIFPERKSGTDYTRTEYVPLGYASECRNKSSPLPELTFIDARLVTGKTHQLRAHMAYIGHPILGDPKYGNAAANRRAREHGITRQLLICERIVFPEEFPQEVGEKFTDFAYLSGKMISCELPKEYEQVMTEDW